MISSVLRFFYAERHYRSPLNFSADLMEASLKRPRANPDSALKSLRIWRQRRQPGTMFTERRKTRKAVDAGLEK